jgi:putative ABC transport system ATP-binding protein
MRLRRGKRQKADNRPEVPAATPGLAVELRDVRRQYGRGAGTVHALAGIDLALPRGTFTAVMGPSGSGKSTFLQCAAGLDRPTAGSVRLGGTEITGMSENELTELRRSRLGFVFQAFNLLPSLTVEQNVLLPMRLAGQRQVRRCPARRCSPRSDPPTRRSAGPESSPAVSSNAWPSPAPWSPAPT